LARSARWWLGRGKIEEAGDLYALAIALAGETVGSDEESLVNTLVRIVMYPVMHVRLEHVADADTFYASLQSSLDKLADGLGKTLEPIIEKARRVVEAGDHDRVQKDSKS
jgi:hypothetical protein